MSRNYNILEINLEDNTPTMSSKPVSTGTGATYEEAFLGGSSEEMSNLKGKGRARRQKRKLDRTAKKKERRLAKVEAKDDVKSAKAESRLERRRKKKSTRQQIRDEQMEARQKRRTKRMEMKEARKGKDEDEDEDEDLVDQPTDTGDEDTEEDTEDQTTGTGADEYADEDEDEDTSSDSRADTSGGDDPDAYEEDAGYDDDSSYDQYPTFEEETNFDGESSSFVNEMTGKKSVSAPVQQICLKIEWNNEMINRLARQKQKMKIDGQDTQRIDQAIDQKFERNQNLENQLQQFIGADGSNNGARAKEVNQAKRIARRKKLRSVIPPQVMANMQKRGMGKQQVKEWWQSKGADKYEKFSGFAGWDGYPDVIYVDEAPSDLLSYGQPQFDYDTDLGSEGGFDPMSFFNGGDTMSFANGEKSTDNSWVKSLLVGLVLGGVTIYVIRRYKLLS